MFNFNQSSEPIVDMDEYYKARIKIRDLYSIGAAMNPKANDLCSEILQLRDKYSCIESMHVNTLKYFIDVELEEDTDPDTRTTITNEIQSTIEKYINYNIEELNPNYKLYDLVVLGNSIKFYL